MTNIILQGIGGRMGRALAQPARILPLVAGQAARCLKKSRRGMTAVSSPALTSSPAKSAKSLSMPALTTCRLRPAAL